MRAAAWTQLKETFIAIGIAGALIMAVPFLLVVMLIGSRMLMVLTGPVNVFNATRRVPPISDLVGQYTSSGMARAPQQHPKARFRLDADNTLAVFELPEFDGFGDKHLCSYSGTGSWRALGDSGGVRLDLNIKDSTPAPAGVSRCGPAALGLFQVLGSGPPYRIWYSIGDPDSGMGIEFTRERK